LKYYAQPSKPIRKARRWTLKKIIWGVENVESCRLCNATRGLCLMLTYCCNKMWCNAVF